MVPLEVARGGDGVTTHNPRAAVEHPLTAAQVRKALRKRKFEVDDVSDWIIVGKGGLMIQADGLAGTPEQWDVLLNAVSLDAVREAVRAELEDLRRSILAGNGTTDIGSEAITDAIMQRLKESGGK